MIFPCAGAADVGELADRVGRKMAKCGKGRMFCLAAIGGRIQGKIDMAKAAGKHIAIDGCEASCAKKILEQAGFSVTAYNLKDLGFEKGKSPANEEFIEKAFSKITGGNN